MLFGYMFPMSIFGKHKFSGNSALCVAEHVPLCPAT